MNSYGYVTWRERFWFRTDWRTHLTIIFGFVMIQISCNALSPYRYNVTVTGLVIGWIPWKQRRDSTIPCRRWERSVAHGEDWRREL